MIWYDKENSTTVHAVYVWKNEENIWTSDDADFINDWGNDVKCATLEICILKE